MQNATSYDTDPGRVPARKESCSATATASPPLAVEVSGLWNPGDGRRLDQLSPAFRCHDRGGRFVCNRLRRVGYNLWMPCFRARAHCTFCWGTSLRVLQFETVGGWAAHGSTCQNAVRGFAARQQFESSLTQQRLWPSIPGTMFDDGVNLPAALVVWQLPTHVSMRSRLPSMWRAALLAPAQHHRKCRRDRCGKLAPCPITMPRCCIPEVQDAHVDHPGRINEALAVRGMLFRTSPLLHFVVTLSLAKVVGLLGALSCTAHHLKW